MSALTVTRLIFWLCMFVWQSQATRIVRTIGQVFEVCCRLQEGPDAANIPGLLPPDKLKAARKAAEAAREGDGVDDEVDGTPSPDGRVHAVRPLSSCALFIDNLPELPSRSSLEKLVV